MFAEKGQTNECERVHIYVCVNIEVGLALALAGSRAIRAPLSRRRYLGAGERDPRLCGRIFSLFQRRAVLCRIARCRVYTGRRVYFTYICVWVGSLGRRSWLVRG